MKWSIDRPKALTLIFDQSYSREFKKDDLLQKKLQYFAANEVSGFAYDSRATFLLLAADSELLRRAREELLEASDLPESRLLSK